MRFELTIAPFIMIQDCVEIASIVNDGAFTGQSFEGVNPYLNDAIVPPFDPSFDPQLPRTLNNNSSDKIRHDIVLYLLLVQPAKHIIKLLLAFYVMLPSLPIQGYAFSPCH